MILLADSEDPDQTAQLRSLIWAFTVITCPNACFIYSAAHVISKFKYYHVIWFFDTINPLYTDIRYNDKNQQISKTNVLWGNKNKTRSFLHIILSIKDSLQQQIHFNGNIFGNKCCRCNEGSLYMYVM